MFYEEAWLIIPKLSLLPLLIWRVCFVYFEGAYISLQRHWYASIEVAEINF